MRKRTLGIVCGKGSIKNHGGGEKKLSIGNFHYL